MQTTPSPPQVEFWLSELRTPELLVQVASGHPDLAGHSDRPAVTAALQENLEAVALALQLEAQEERRRDREYWEPLRRELETLRLARTRST